MSRFDKLVQLHRILQGRRYPISKQALLDELGCSAPTLKRLIAELRDGYGAPIRTERGLGYRYDTTDGRFELPGLWFTPSELTALAHILSTLDEIGGGLLHEQFAPFRSRIEQLIAKRNDAQPKNLTRRIRILSQHARTAEPSALETCQRATLARLKLRIEHHNRATDTVTERIVSPQRLTRYRGTWYLDAWCHLREGLRCFALDALRASEILPETAVEIDDAQLDETLGSAYGIFTGPAQHTAKLLFSAERARWVRHERWHPGQRQHEHPDGRLELHVPYGDPRELVMDILRHGPHVRVLDPPALREQVTRALRDALAQYPTNEPPPAANGS